MTDKPTTGTGRELTHAPTLRLPSAEELAREHYAASGGDWRSLSEMVWRTRADCAQSYLDALARLVPCWVPVPDDATIPAGVTVRHEYETSATECTYGHDTEFDPDAARGIFVASTDLDKLTYPEPWDAELVDDLARAVHAAASPGRPWDDVDEETRDYYRANAREMLDALEARGITTRPGGDRQ